MNSCPETAQGRWTVKTNQVDARHHKPPDDANGF